MTMVELFTNGYKEKAKSDDLVKFTHRCRQFGDRLDTKELLKRGVTFKDLKEEFEDGLITSETRCGITRRELGYSLTAKGIREIHRRINL